jgi:hypothetical protein
MDAVERLSIIEDLRRLMAFYVRSADHHRWQDLAGLFTPDGTFTPHKPDGSVWLRMEGREKIAEMVGSSGGPDDVLIHHLFSDETDVESATSAHGVWAMEDIITRPENAGTSTRPCPAWPVRRNPANPAPAGRQGRGTAARHPATTWARPRRGTARSRHDANAQVKQQA